MPDASEGISYGVPAFFLGGVPIAGFAASKRNLSYFPHSGSVIDRLPAGMADGYSTSKGTLRFPLDEPLPRHLVEHLLAIRIAMLEG